MDELGGDEKEEGSEWQAAWRWRSLRAQDFFSASCRSATSSSASSCRSSMLASS